MATNKRISALDNLGATPAVGDILPITDVDDPTGSPQGTTKGVTVANLMGASPVQSVAGRTGAVSIANTDVSGLGTAATTDASAYATAAQGTLADSATQPGDLGTAAATDSTDYATAAQGTLADSATQPADLGTAAVKDVGTSNGNVVELDATGLPAVDGSQLINLPSPDVNGPLTTALRGTDNPHIGAYPNQSLKVIDNPSGSVVVVTDSDGNLDFVVKNDSSKAYLTTPSGRLELTTGVSVVEDSTEPDIEITTTSGTYSLISGDSDTKGANGLPIRQGFNIPDIGANPAPLLISGGSIA